MNSQHIAIHLEGNPWNIRAHCRWKVTKRYLQCGTASCDHPSDLYLSDRGWLLSRVHSDFHMPCEKSDVLTAAWQPNVKCFTSQHGDSQKPWLERHSDSPLKCTPCRRTRPGEGPVRPCPTVSVRSHACCSFLFPVLPIPARSWPGPVHGRGWHWGCWRDGKSVYFLLAVPSDIQRERKEDGWMISEQAGHLLTNWIVPWSSGALPREGMLIKIEFLEIFKSGSRFWWALLFRWKLQMNP